MSHDPTAIIQSLERYQIVTYLHLSCNGLLAYDYFLTFADEVRHVYGAPWNIGKVLFYLTRYPVFVDTALTLHHQVAYHLSVKDCKKLFSITGWMIIIGIVVAEVIMTLRVWALYSRTRRIALLLSILAVTTIVGGAVGFTKFHTSQTFIAMDEISPTIPGCFPSDGNNLVFISFTVLMAYETAILLLTLNQWIQHFRHGSSSFITTFFQDGVLYFAALLAISVVNVVVLLTEPREYANLMTSVQRALHSILSARILLRLRKESEKTKNHPDSPTELGAIGELVFANSEQTQIQSEGATWHTDVPTAQRSRPWNVDDGTWFGNI